MIDVHTFKYDGSPHYSYRVELVERTEDLWVLKGEYGRTLIHHTRGETYVIPNQSVEFVWPGRPYMVAVDVTSGKADRFYCNVILPPTFADDRIEWVDLDLDLVVAADLSWELVDEDEFLAHQDRFGYPPEVVALARQAAADLIKMVEARAFPFHGGQLY